MIEVLMKEVLYDEKVYMLYRMRTAMGDLSGFYDTKSGFLFSVFLDADDVRPYKKVREVLLFLYACAVTRNGPQRLQDLPKYFWYAAADEKPTEDSKMVVRMFSRGGKLTSTYTDLKNDDDTLGKRKGNDRYQEVERPIQGFIRKLGGGRVASDQAREYAEALGYSLAPDETYVRPFTKHVLRLKENF